ncbi:MAG: sugar-binding protein [Candidatus Hinthialibacter sp.]
MNKCGFILLVLGFGALAGFAQDTSVNVNSFTIPELPGIPIIDGDLSDPVWADVPAIPMDKDGDSPAAAPGTGDLDIVLKVAWDDETNALYFGINVIDDAFVNVMGMGSSAGTGGWNNERLEVIIDGTNTGDSGSTTTSGLHQQYTFDMPNSWDNWDPGNDIEAGVLYDGNVGFFYTEGGGIAPSEDFVSAPVFERIEGTLNLDGTHAPWNIADDYVESAAQIRATEAGLSNWVEAPVEFNWEIKIVPFGYLMPNADLGVDLGDPNNIANGWLEFWEDPAHEKLDLEENMVIGFTVQQNDADLWSEAPTREHQTNTTGFAGNWNSSENLSGIILGPGATPVFGWELQ